MSDSDEPHSTCLNPLKIQSQLRPGTERPRRGPEYNFLVRLVDIESKQLIFVVVQDYPCAKKKLIGSNAVELILAVIAENVVRLRHVPTLAVALVGKLSMVARAQL